MSNTIANFAMFTILTSKQFDVGSKFLLTLSILFIPMQTRTQADSIRANYLCSHLRYVNQTEL